jgi:hypothetical protein
MMKITILCRIVRRALPTVLVIATLVPAVAARGEAAPTFTVELEGGAVWQTINDVQIPNTDEGTRFSLIDIQDRGPWPAARLYLTWNINARHSLRGMASPLSVTETGLLTQSTGFEGETFAANTPIEATYRFNSWRITYAYRFHRGSRWSWWVGFTAKVRDAKIELTQDGVSATKTNVGFVPLLHVRGRYRFTPTWGLALDLDALAGGPGRAEDGSLKLYADVGKRWTLAVGYRTLEGGADVEEVYNFAWLHYAVVSASYHMR